MSVINHMSPEEFEPIARRIRSRAQRMLNGIPPEDANVVWARRTAIVREKLEMRVLLRACPSCGSAAGIACRTESGNAVWPVTDSHAARHALIPECSR